MPGFQRLTERDLRAAMRDRRYWDAGHPDRAGYGAWVEQGWRALHPEGEPARGAVWVRPYLREGHPVAGHWRDGPPRGGMVVPVGARPPRDPTTGQPILPGRPSSPLEGPGGGGHGGSAGRAAPQPWRPPAGQASPAALASPPGPRTIALAPGQVQRKYKHAEAFSLPTNWTRANGSQFESVLRAHIENPSTLRIVGTYRGQQVIHYLDDATRLNVLTDRSGNFISAWRVTDTQFMNLWYRGSL